MSSNIVGTTVFTITADIEIAAKRYNTTPCNITSHENPDCSVVYYKKAEFDENGKTIGMYKPILNRFGYAIHDIRTCKPFFEFSKCD